MSLRSIDFSRPVRAVSALGMALLFIGALALLASGICHHRWAAEREVAAQQAQREAEALRARRAAKPVAAAPSSDERRLQRATLERARPWMPALRAIEAATRDPVYLLSLSADAGSGSFRLEGEAPSFEHALAYVQVLPDGVGISTASLLSHEETNDPASGRRVVRFAVRIQWAMP